MCFTFTAQPDPHPPVLKVQIFPVAPELLVSWSNLQQILSKPNYVHFYGAIFSLTSMPGEWNAVYESSVYKSSPLTSLHFLNPSWGPTSHVLSETECLAPSQIDRRTTAQQRGLRGTWERTEPPDGLSSFALSTWLWLSAGEYSPEMDEIGSISNDFERTMLSSPTWGNCRLYREEGKWLSAVW